jgi:hypothetical protein
MRVLVCGGRDFKDQRRLVQCLHAIHGSTPFSVLIHGGAAGADRMAAAWAKRHGIPVETYFADWQTFGRKAGPIRNQEMLDDGKPDLVLAFPGGRGTADMVARAERAGVNVVRL